MTAYILVAAFLLVVLILLNCFFFVEEGFSEKDDFKLWCSVNAISLICIVIWPLVIPFAILGLIGYGLYNIPTLIRTIRNERS